MGFFRTFGVIIQCSNNCILGIMEVCYINTFKILQYCYNVRLLAILTSITKCLFDTKKSMLGYKVCDFTLYATIPNSKMIYFHTSSLLTNFMYNYLCIYTASTQ